MSNPKGAKLVFTVLLLFFMPATYASVFFYTPGCIEAQKHIASLRLAKAEQILAVEAKANPNNAAIPFLQNSVDFYRIIAEQSFVGYKAEEQAKSYRFDMAKKIPLSSPYHLYAQSEMHLQWAFIKVFHAEYVGAMLEFRNAYQLANQNLTKFPEFKPSLKTVGMFKALLGTTPKNYKWVLGVAGLSGNYEKGMAMLEQYVKADVPADAILDEQMGVFYYGLFMLNFGDKQKAWEFTQAHTLDWNTNLMSCYLRAFTASKVAQNDEAIRVLQNRPKTADYESFPMLDYMLGQYKLNRLDEDADQPLKRFVSFYKGKVLMNDAYRRLSWHYLVHGDEDKFKVYRELSKRYRKEQSEEEKNTQYEMDKHIPHDVIVLKARLLFDGGYYAKAEEVIKQRSIEQCKTTYQKLEYYYRYGRICQEAHRYSKAVELFSAVIKNANTSTTYYFAPNACYQLGVIYAKTGFKQLAESYFKQVPAYKHAEYIESIEVKAETELEKLK